MDDIGQALARITMGPYISKAMALIGKSRKAGSNMFRHQLDTMAILVDYKMIDPILLKAAVIHDLFEECCGMPGVSRQEIVGVDADGQAVYDLVMEVTLRERDGKREPKSEFLKRIMETGSPRAKMLKLADRISNLISLGFVHDDQFVRDVLAETRQFILPYAERINPNMYREMYDLVADRENKLMLRCRNRATELPTQEKRTA
ncbi:MAG: bifunctional (p)ppGpp synthetase/guanosine-3',5'-bis(diphosphate) 3'-pyrophosphohydrolase [Acidobacteria bacterium]|nr:MAG: bifunctional (p)ppGpp synthetase/guanosine-3',5'-bis(diphosphate) 3'-pyrophosphohydrolase [Acidobacteriota bacterium]